MKVVLAHVGERYDRGASSPPLGILSLAAWARHRISGLDIRVEDQYLDGSTYPEMVRRIVADSPKVIGLSYMTRAAAFIPQLTRAIKEALPDSTILLGGPHPSAAESNALEESEADALVVGEGEVSFEMLLERVASGADFSDIPGLIYRAADGEVTTNPGESPPLEDLDALPFIAYDLVDIEAYWRVQSQSVIMGPRRYVTLFTSRGCPYRCIYCHDVFGKSFRAQSAERIIAEIEHFQQQYGVRQIDFMDDIFNLDKKRVFEFSRMATERNMNMQISMGNGVRTDILTQEVVDALVDAGLFVSGFALESGSKRIQKLIKKNLNIDKFLHGVEMMARKRVYSYGMNIFGFPTETADEIQQTIDTATNSMLHMAYFFMATPYPKTALYDAAMEMCPERMQGIDYANHDYQYEPVVNLSTVSDAELAHFARSAIRTFYSKPSRLLRVARDFPTPRMLPRYVPGAVRMAIGGSFGLFRKEQQRANAPGQSVGTT